MLPLWSRQKRAGCITHQKTVRQKLFVSFLAAILVPLLLFSLFASTFTLSHEVQQKRQQLALLSHSIALVLRDQLEQIDRYVYGLSATPWVEKLMYAQHDVFDYSRFDPVEIHNYNQQIFMSTMLNPFVLTMDLVLNTKDLVFSGGTYLSRLADYLGSFFYPDGSDHDQLRNAISRHTSGSILSPVVRSAGVRPSVLYVKTIPGKGDSVVRATVISELNMDYLSMYITQLETGPGVEVLLVADGNLLAGDAAMWNRYRDHYASAAEAEDQSQRISLNGDVYTRFASTTRDVRVIVLARNREYFSTLPIIIVIAIAAVAAAVVSAYFLARLIASRNYRPLATLMSLLKSPGDHAEEIAEMEEEYSTIYNSYQSTLNSNSANAVAIRRQQESLVEYCWQVLLESTHEIEDSVLEKLYEFDPIEVCSQHFCAVVTDGAHRTLAEAIASRVKTVSGTVCNIVRYARFTALVVHVIDSVAQDRVHRTMIDCLSPGSPPSERCGVGSAYRDITQVNRSYNEAMFMVSCRPTSTANQVFYERGLERFVSRFAYSMRDETRLGNALRNGDFDAVMSTVRDLTESNRQLHPATPNVVRNLQFAVYLTGMRIGSELGLDLHAYKDPFELLNFHSIDETFDLVNGYLREICDAVQRESADGHDPTEDISRYIEQNITNPNLSMQLVSDHINRSLAYTSRCFNRAFSMTFIEYVSRSRVDIAAQLIRSTEMPIKDVAKMAGFTSEITFRRSFLRYMGVTAGKYRLCVGKAL